ncbi:hypothetical protein OAT67_01165 [Bacteriovoracaceae bacterium]|nr:hypothetical protein [Bacteriovoracaceae bacterium]
MSLQNNQNTRQFGPIYKTLQQLMESNQGLFKLFNKVKSPGLIQAIWQARQIEVDALSSHLNETEIKLAQAKEEIQRLRNLKREDLNNHQSTMYKVNELLDKRDDEIIWLKKVNDSNKVQIDFLDEENGILKEKKEKLEKFSRDIERALAITQTRLIEAHRKAKLTEDNLAIAHAAIIKMDDDSTEKEETILELQEEVGFLQRELDDLKTYAKEYRKINHKMENELYRVNSELEKVQTLVN